MTLGTIYQEGKQFDDARAAFTKAKDLGQKAAEQSIRQLDSMEKQK